MLATVRQKFDFLTLNVGNLLQTLTPKKHTAFPLFYLNDHHHPVVALYPAYWEVKCEEEVRQWFRSETGSLKQAQAHKLPQYLRENLEQNVNELGFTGGWMQLLGYDQMAWQQGVVTPITSAGCHYRGWFDVFLRQESSGWQLWASDEACELGLVQRLLDLIKGLEKSSFTAGQTSQPALSWRADWQFEQYQAAFDQVQAHLLAGDAYQINLTQCWASPISPENGSLLAWLPVLFEHSKAPFSGYFTDGNALEVLSVSPELFVEIDQQRRWRSEPIKGTRPRSPDPVEDKQLRSDLEQSEKDRAENLMIVDLLRNDLGRFAVLGSVQVPRLFFVESFAQVHHLVSEIVAQLRPEVDLQTALEAALPGGSITGAPKINAMRLIAALESRPRGAYCGSMGYLNARGGGRFNILIRTLQRQFDEVTLWAGGGITVASEVQAEYDECLHKVGKLLQLTGKTSDINMWSDIEFYSN